MNCVRNCDDFLMKTYAAVIINRSVKDNYHALIKKKNLGTNGLSSLFFSCILRFITVTI